MVYSPVRQIGKKSIDFLSKVNNSPLSLAPMVGNLASVGSRLNRKQYLPAAAQALTGTTGAVAADSLQRAGRTAARAKQRSINPVFGATRGFYTGLKKNRRDFVNSVTGGGVTIGETLNGAVKKSPLGGTKLGKALTTDISTPLVSAFRPRQKLRFATGGLFDECYFLSDVAEFSIEYRGRTLPGYNKPVDSDRPGKKKMVLAKKGDKVKLLHFGHTGYRHNYSEQAKKSYRARAGGIRNKNGELTKNDVFSPNHWSMKVLWGKNDPIIKN